MMKRGFLQSILATQSGSSRVISWQIITLGMNITNAKQRTREENYRIFNEQMEMVCSSEMGGMVSRLLQEIAQETVDEVAAVESAIVKHSLLLTV